jgi:hypothetical protein
MAKVPTNEMKVASGIHIVPQTTSMNLFKTENSYLGSAIPENRSFFGRFFSLTTACFFVRSLVSFLSDVGDAGVWLRLRRAMS